MCLMFQQLSQNIFNEDGHNMLSKRLKIIYQTIQYHIPEDVVIGYISLSLDSKLQLDLFHVNA
jgi:hypothetical protein